MTNSRAPKAPPTAPDPSGLPTPPPEPKTQPRGGQGPRWGCIDPDDRDRYREELLNLGLLESHWY